MRIVHTTDEQEQRRENKNSGNHAVQLLAQLSESRSAVE
jgi:hypothetical protein